MAKRGSDGFTGVTDMIAGTVGNTEAGELSHRPGRGDGNGALPTSSGGQVGFCGSSFASLHNGRDSEPLLAPFLRTGPSNYQAGWLMTHGATLRHPGAQVPAADASTPRRARVESRL